MKTLFIIGRDYDCDIILVNDSNEISRHHAQIRIDQSGKFWLMDMSLNGTYVNGVRIPSNQEVEVNSKDEIVFAGVERFDWNSLPKKKNKLLWIVLPISLVVLIAIIVISYIFFIPKKTIENRGAAIPNFKVIENVETSQDPLESNEKSDVDSLSISNDVVLDVEREADRVVEEINKDLARKRREAEAKAKAKKRKRKSSNSTTDVKSIEDETIIDAIF
jgi:hypothetical protein